MWNSVTAAPRLVTRKDATYILTFPIHYKFVSWHMKRNFPLLVTLIKTRFKSAQRQIYCVCQINSPSWTKFLWQIWTGKRLQTSGGKSVVMSNTNSKWGTQQRSGWSATLQAQKSRVWDPIKWIKFFKLLNHSSCTRPWGFLSF
jgi:hypothetical protein